MDSTLFYVLLFAHLASLATGFGAVVVIDSFGLLWLLKKVPISLVNKVANVTQALIWIGWGGLVASGIPMLVLKGSVDNLTLIKLFLVLMLGLNGIFLHRLKRSFDRLSDTETVPRPLRFRIGLASAISQTGWWGAMLIGFLHRQVAHTIGWPGNPYWIIGAVVAAIAAAAAAGTLLNEKGTHRAN